MFGRQDMLSAMGKSKGRAQQFADLEKPHPKDFDPEDASPAHSEEGSGSEDSDDGLAGTEHYTSAGKSKLRKSDEVVLGPQYSGSQISRNALIDSDGGIGKEDRDEESEGEYADAEEGTYADPDDVDSEADDDDDAEIDSDAAFGESDAEKFKSKGFTFRGSGKREITSKKKRRPSAADFMSDSDEESALNGDELEADETDEDILDIDAQHSEDLEDGNGNSAQEDDSENDVEDESDEDDAMDDEDMDSVSSSASEDNSGEKLRRAELRKIMNEEQKTVVAAISKAAKADTDKGTAVLQQRKTFDSLLSIRIALQKGLVAANSMAAVNEIEAEDAEELPYQAAEDAAIKLWNTLDGLRQLLNKASSAKVGQKRKRGIDSSTPSSMIWEQMQDSELALLDHRQTTLEKWSNKVKDTTALPLSRKLNNIQPQSKLSMLQDQVARRVQENGNSNVFDDTKFYKTLLNNFVDQRRMNAFLAGGHNGGPAQFIVVKEAKMRKKVDTKASKGRKMRFTVQEKLQNFMAPENRASWESEAIDRFFGTLLGQKMTLGEEIEPDEGDEDQIPLEEQGLMLFRS